MISAATPGSTAAVRDAWLDMRLRFDAVARGCSEADGFATGA
ncbi:MAG TPA: hypothetical protein VG474_11510 [Solirubrobacteraceae bacterium]|nr:hypothetical protein [Solirubrobacteraceae bacterium]